MRSPVEASTIQSSLSDPREVGVMMVVSLAQTMRLPSGDHEGLNHEPVIRRADSPVAPMMKMPPPSQSER